MLTEKRITSMNDPLYDQFDSLYETAFPYHEKRQTTAKLMALQNSKCFMQSWFDDGKFIGISVAWQLGRYTYIEQFAIDMTLRAKGYGKSILTVFLQQNPATILEIDPLESETAYKRLNFYCSLGFVVNDFPHFHPAYHSGIADHQLIVLSYPKLLGTEDYLKFSYKLSTIVMANAMPDI